MIFMKIKTSNLLSLNQALQSIDAFKLTPAVCLNLTRNLRLTRAACSDIEAVELKLRKTPDQTGVKFQEDWREVLVQEAELDLRTVTIEELDLDKNAIPITTLTGLAPIISNFDES